MFRVGGTGGAWRERAFLSGLCRQLKGCRTTAEEGTEFGSP